MSAHIDWDEIRRVMDLVRSMAEDGPDGLSLVDPENETEFACLLAAYPSNDELPLRWMLEGSYQGMKGVLALGTANNRIEYVVLGCPESILECCLIPSSHVETGIKMLAEQSEIAPPWRWVPFLEAW